MNIEIKCRSETTNSKDPQRIFNEGSTNVPQNFIFYVIDTLEGVDEFVL